MKRLQWWFRLVGSFYLLLFVMNVYMLFFGGEQLLLDNFPFPADALALRAFVDGWSPFLFEIFAIGSFMVWASRDVGRYLGAVPLLIWLELLHGVADDLFLIARGYAAGGYVAFIVVHLIIAGTGYLFARSAAAARDMPLAAGRVAADRGGL